jgi:hypothetical protein
MFILGIKGKRAGLKVRGLRARENIYINVYK